MATEKGELLVLARIQFPSLGPTAEVIVTDRRDVAAMFPGAELRVLDWGAISTLVDGGQDGVDITLSNAPDAAGDRFSEYWDSTNPPEGARVTFEASKVDATTPVWFTFFVGAVIQVSRVTEQQVVLRIADIGTRFERKIGDQITTTEFPQAPEEVLGSIKPIVLNEVQEYKPPLVREAKTCVLVDSILATETASVAVPLQKAVNTTKGWPKVGQARIDDEILSYDNTTETTGKKFLFTSRGAVAVHSPGDPIVELAKLKWCIAGHAVNPAKTIVYAISSKGTLAKLTETTDYTLTTGATGSFVELVSDSGLKVKFPSDEATIRRVEMDEAVNNGFTIGQVNPTAYNQAEYNTIATPVVGSNQAKNAAMACGDANEWGPNTYALMDKIAHDTLCVLRHDPFTEPTAPFSKAWLAVEHFGITQFGPSSELMADINEADTLVTVANLSVFDTIVGNLRLYIDGEVMAITGLDTATKTFSVFRGSPDVNGIATQAKKHYAGAQVLAYYHDNTPVKEYYQPDIHAFLETGVNTKVVQEIGVVTDITDIPFEVEKDDNTYTEAKTLEAWHGHSIQGLPISGKTYNMAATIDLFSDSYQYDAEFGDFLPSTIGPAAIARSQSIAPLQSDAHSYINISGDNSPWSAIFRPRPGMNIALLQRIIRIRFRLLFSNDCRLRMWVPNPAGGVITLVNTVLNAGSSYPPEMRQHTVKVDNTTTFPDGIRWQQLLHKETVIQVDSESGTTKLYYFAVDFDFDESQLAPNSTEYISERQAIYGIPTMVSSTGTGSYSNSGKVTMPPGSPTPDTKGVVELMASTAPAWITHSGNTPKNVNGTDEGLVQFTTAPATATPAANAVDQVKVYWQNPSASGSARVLKAAVFMVVAGKDGASSCSYRLKSNTLNLAPDSVSTGSMTDHANQTNDLVRRNWRAIWNLENREVSVRQFVNEWYWQIDAGGSGTNAIWCDSIYVYMEVDEDRSTLAHPKKGEQFTRVKYFDVTDKLTSYANAIDRRVEFKMRAKRNAGPDGIIVSDDEKQRSILVHRVWWAFQYVGTVEETLERIAVTTEGFAPSNPAAPTASLLKTVLTNGDPLMSCASSDLDLAAFAALEVEEAGGQIPIIAGVIEDQIGAAELLSKLTDQTRVSGMWENGKYRPIFKPLAVALPSAVATFSDSDGSILPDSLEIIRETKDDVYNFVTVKARKEWVSTQDATESTDGYKTTKTYKSDISIAKYGKRPLDYEAAFVREDAGADSLAKQKAEYAAEVETKVRFQTTLFDKAVTLKRGQIIAVKHELATYRKLQVYGIRKAVGSVGSGIPVFEIEAVVPQFITDLVQA